MAHFSCARHDVTTVQHISNHVNKLCESMLSFLYGTRCNYEDKRRHKPTTDPPAQVVTSPLTLADAVGQPLSWAFSASTAFSGADGVGLLAHNVRDLSADGSGREDRGRFIPSSVHCQRCRCLKSSAAISIFRQGSVWR